jgi:hypothetical protein
MSHETQNPPRNHEAEDAENTSPHRQKGIRNSTSLLTSQRISVLRVPQELKLVAESSSHRIIFRPTIEAVTKSTLRGRSFFKASNRHVSIELAACHAELRGPKKLLI